jgi:hypothetical protein
LPHGGLIIRTGIQAKRDNTRKTVVRLEIGPQDFPALLAAMSKANRQEAIKAMANELYSVGTPDFAALLAAMSKADRQAAMETMARELLTQVEAGRDAVS